MAKKKGTKKTNKNKSLIKKTNGHPATNGNSSVGSNSSLTSSYTTISELAQSGKRHTNGVMGTSSESTDVSTRLNDFITYAQPFIEGEVVITDENIPLIIAKVIIAIKTTIKLPETSQLLGKKAGIETPQSTLENGSKTEMPEQGNEATNGTTEQTASPEAEDEAFTRIVKTTLEYAAALETHISEFLANKIVTISARIPMDINHNNIRRAKSILDTLNTILEQAEIYHTATGNQDIEQLIVEIHEKLYLLNKNLATHHRPTFVILNQDSLVNNPIKVAGYEEEAVYLKAALRHSREMADPTHYLKRLEEYSVNHNIRASSPSQVANNQPGLIPPTEVAEHYAILAHAVKTKLRLLLATQPPTQQLTTTENDSADTTTPATDNTIQTAAATDITTEDANIDIATFLSTIIDGEAQLIHQEADRNLGTYLNGKLTFESPEEESNYRHTKDSYFTYAAKLYHLSAECLEILTEYNVDVENQIMTSASTKNMAMAIELLRTLFTDMYCPIIDSRNQLSTIDSLLAHHQAIYQHCEAISLRLVMHQGPAAETSPEDIPLESSTDIPSKKLAPAQTEILTNNHVTNAPQKDVASESQLLALDQLIPNRGIENEIACDIWTLIEVNLERLEKCLANSQANIVMSKQKLESTQRSLAQLNAHRELLQTQLAIVNSIICLINILSGIKPYFVIAKGVDKLHIPNIVEFQQTKDNTTQALTELKAAIEKSTKNMKKRERKKRQEIEKRQEQERLEIEKQQEQERLEKEQQAQAQRQREEQAERERKALEEQKEQERKKVEDERQEQERVTKLRRTFKPIFTQLTEVVVTRHKQCIDIHSTNIRELSMQLDAAEEALGQLAPSIKQRDKLANSIARCQARAKKCQQKKRLLNKIRNAYDAYKKADGDRTTWNTQLPEAKKRANDAKQTLETLLNDYNKEASVTTDKNGPTLLELTFSDAALVTSTLKAERKKVVNAGMSASRNTSTYGTQLAALNAKIQPIEANIAGLKEQLRTAKATVEQEQQQIDELRALSLRR